MSDFQLALAQLRDNAVIDYTQLGLDFKLQAWEVSEHWLVQRSHAKQCHGLRGALCEFMKGLRLCHGPDLQ